MKNKEMTFFKAILYLIGLGVLIPIIVLPYIAYWKWLVNLTL